MQDITNNANSRISYDDLGYIFTDLYNTTKMSNKKRRSLRCDKINKLKHNNKVIKLKKIGLALFDGADSSAKNDLFTCPSCRKILNVPVTADCGHTFCVECLDKVAMKCVVCYTDIGTLRCTNVLVQDIVTKWREIHSQIDEEHRIPETGDILGLEPRYYLRSRNAGLQPRLGCDENNINKIVRRLLIPKRKVKNINGGWYDKRKRKLNHKFNLMKENFTHTDISSREYSSVSISVDRLLKNADIVREKALRTSWKHITISDLECILCSRCFLDPITTKCGHTFCRGCLARVIDHGLACPLCMAALTPAEENRGTTLAIQQAITFLIPAEYQERLTASKQEIKFLEKDSKVPVFVCTNAFPGVACPLYVYEPRYRLLARRLLQSKTRRFAMAARTETAEKFASFGTILEVKDAVHLHDGRSILTTVGARRFKVVEKGEQDGYDTALVHYIKDNTVPVEKLPELWSLHQRVYSKAARWVKSLTPRVLAEVENCIGQMPALELDWYKLPDGPAWAWWLMPILPLTSQLQVGFLSTTNLEKRLRAIDKMLEHMKIKMRALKRNTLKCAHTVENSDSCRLSWLL